ncbi:serine carboxypeptidase S28-domain-containing protein [Kockovaella imperatae]|uniref:Serine carboxypeptidase S28-domain-containing protein n=1 Tax=Kockovaella imperatae TaxID=4999 RepID=A0A1Y1UMG6_9TREE|nr:serine carboxypeptidase S28-domain-containing protein [Kockovaella imperatae]ORX39182.1 serine carboxypeptidase S28-domain-containing protein [Kockovaella imperatae]
MRASTVSLGVIGLLGTSVNAISRLDGRVSEQLLRSGPPQIGLFQALLAQQTEDDARVALHQNSAQKPLQVVKPTYEAHCFPQLKTHFNDEDKSTFCQRYWVDASNYKEGGPVFVLDGGETDGANRIPFLEKGILQILANATGGLSIVLEHRYYGESIFVDSLTTDNLRWLNNEEALEDSAYFIENFKLPKSVLDVEADALSPKKTPWIYYGGSYAGARAAHMRVQYPHLVWGAIASSGVTHAQVEYSEYFQPIQKYGPVDCISALSDAITAVDSILDIGGPAAHALKSLFGLAELSDDQDFASLLSTPLGFWQGQNWDPKVGTDGFENFCAALLEPSLPILGKYGRIPSAVVNLAKYIRENIVSRCPRTPGNPASDIEECFGTQNATKYLNTDLDQEWRLWEFQVCTQWGYFQFAPAEGPRIVSKRVDLEYASKPCRLAYPPGEHFTVPAAPDVESVNARGDFAIEMDRLAFIDGDRDPWRPATPGSDLAPKRKSTVNKPVHLIYNGIHHYDENGLSDHDKEPARIRDIHELEKNFISEWVAHFHDEKAKTA